MISEELIQAWRKWGKSMGGMVRVRKSTLQKTHLPEETKQFLFSFPSSALDNYIAKYEQAVRKIDPVSVADDTWGTHQTRNTRAEYGL